MADASNRKWRRRVLNLAIVLALLVGVEFVLRAAEPPEFSLEHLGSTKGPLFVEDPNSDPPQYVNNYRSVQEPTGAPIADAPPEGPNAKLMDTVKEAMHFAKEKPAGRVRMFILGTSPVWGFVGHREGDHTLLAVYLNEAIRRLYPSIDAEVINGAHVGMGGNEVVESLDEVIEYEPDLVAVYFGGVMPAMTTPNQRDDVLLPPTAFFLLRWLDKSRVFRELRLLLTPKPAEAQPIDGPESPPIDIPPRPPQKDPAGVPLFGPGSQPLEQPDEYDADMAHMATNLGSGIQREYQTMFRDMAKLMAERGVAGVYYTVATNQADFSPFWSLHQKPIGPAELEQFARLLTSARRERDGGNLAVAQTYFEKALELGPTFAAAHYELGQVYRERGLDDKARASFRAAKEWDASNERALDRPNQLLREAADEFGLHTIDSEEVVLSLPQAQGYLGKGVFIDLQHVKPAGVKALAEALAVRLPELLPQFEWK
jgi:tetratricopeptide (TPR) repeat protein